MIIETCAVGNIIVEDLKLKLIGKKIYDLSTLVSNVELKRSCSPGGSLYYFIHSTPPIIKVIRPIDDNYVKAIQELNYVQMEAIAAERQKGYRRWKKDFFAAQEKRKMDLLDELDSIDFELMCELLKDIEGAVKEKLLTRMSSLEGERIHNNFILI